MLCTTKILFTFVLSIALSNALPASAQTIILQDESAPGIGVQPLELELAEARRNLEIAKIELRLFVQVDHPRKKRHLEANIKLVRKEIDGLKKRVREYKGFRRSKYSNPFLVSLHNAELALLAAELRYKDFREERSALRRFYTDRCRLYELKVAAARARVIALDRAINS